MAGWLDQLGIRLTPLLTGLKVEAELGNIRTVGKLFPLYAERGIKDTGARLSRPISSTRWCSGKVDPCLSSLGRLDILESRYSRGTRDDFLVFIFKNH